MAKRVRYLSNEDKKRYENLERMSEKLKKKDGSYTTREVAEMAKDYVILSEKKKGRG